MRDDLDSIWGDHIEDAAILLGLWDGTGPEYFSVDSLREDLSFEEWVEVMRLAVELRKIDLLSPRHTHISGDGILEDLRYFKDDQ